MACLFPRTISKITTRGKKVFTVRCRQCHECRIQTIVDYEFQCIMAQQQAYKSGLGCSFVTLTYTEARLPTVPYSDDEIGTLRRKHFVDFWQSLKNRLKYKGYPYSKVFHFSCGEYGDRFDRPHYHALIFGLSSEVCRDFVSNSWPHGIIDVGSLRPGGIRYVVDYVLKNPTGKLASELYDAIGLERPFLTHSTRLGLDYFMNDFVYDRDTFTYLRNGKRVPIPASYRHKLDPSRDFEYNDSDYRSLADDIGVPFDIYMAKRSLENSEVDVLKLRQRSKPVDNLGSSLVNYITSSYYSARREKRLQDNFYKLCEDFCVSNNLPTNFDDFEAHCLSRGYKNVKELYVSAGLDSSLARGFTNFLLRNL